MVVMNLDDPIMWFQACEQIIVLFKSVMLMAMENPTISWHHDTFQYATIHGGGINLRFINLSLEILCTCSKQY